MEKNRFGLLALVLISAVLVLGGCQKIKDIRVESVKVGSLNVRGLKGADIVLDVEVDNPAGKIAFSEIEGELKHSGKVLGKVAVAPFVLEARTQKKYSIEATADIAEGVSFRDLMVFADLKRLEECTLDMKAKVKMNGGGRKKVAVKDIPLKKLLEEVNR